MIPSKKENLLSQNRNKTRGKRNSRGSELQPTEKIQKAVIMNKKPPNISPKKLYHFALLPTWIRVPADLHSC